ncbi:MAG: MFS transporter [Thermoplasmata archaeon]|nr:MFS transporter [Thermoplasmata archaeon]
MEHAVRTWPHRILARPWLAVFVPINAATSGFGVVFPLLILLSLHGAWTDVALAATLFNGAVILASVGWGWVSDHYHSRRVLLAVNFGGFGLIYLALAEVHTIAPVFLLYTAVGAIAPSGANASNLLMLEKFSSAERPSAFASFQLMSMVGAVTGLLVGYVWLVTGRPLDPLLIVLAGLALLSAAAVLASVKDSDQSAASSSVARHPESLASHLRHSIGLRLFVPLFPVRPTLTAGSVRRFTTWVRAEVRHELPLIFAATLLFNLSSNLFNISYTPYLVTLGISGASIFLVNLANNGAQAIVYPTSGALASEVGADRLVQRSTYLRSLGYLAVAGFTFIPLTVAVALYANVVAFAVLGAAIAFYTTASSLLLFRALEGRDAGRLLGFNSALGGIAAVAGAGLSGLLSVYGSFRLVFLVSAGALLISLPLWSAATLAFARRHAAPPPESPPADGRGNRVVRAAETD